MLGAVPRVRQVTVRLLKAQAVKAPLRSSDWRSAAPACKPALMKQHAGQHGLSARDHEGLREGEIAVELPPRFDASLYFIGRIHTPWKSRDDCPKNGRESDAECTIVVDERWVGGLKGLETVSHVLVLYWMDQARRDLVLQSPRHYAERRGTFALRSPVRPNPIAASVVRLDRIDRNTLYVVGLDCLDNTPLLDIKPYFASTDSVPDASVGWHANRKRTGRGSK
jgi:tRNA-Thr(GGU) m(6)t(6)A37 methyltransferase TsaA